MIVYNRPDSATSTATNPTVTFTEPGKYTVRLVAESSFGCADSVERTILIRDGVEAAIVGAPVEGCSPLKVWVQDSSSYDPALDTIASVILVTSDGQTIALTAPPFQTFVTFTSFGTQWVQSYTTMTSGCADSSAKLMLNVYPTPQPDFSVNYINITTREFENLTVSQDPNVQVFWTFSDGQTSTEYSPVMRFNASFDQLDSIEACLYVVNSLNCGDSLCKSFWIWPYNLRVPNAFAPEIDYAQDDNSFIAKGHSLKEFEIWVYDQWGNEVFYSNALDADKMPAEAWDGTDGRGNAYPMGVYAWRVRALFDDDHRWEGQANEYGQVRTYGTLTLIR